MKNILFISIVLLLSSTGIAKTASLKKPTQEEAIVSLAKQVSLAAVLDLTRSGTSIEDYKFLVDNYKKAKISIDGRSPFTVNTKKELLINGQMISFKEGKAVYKGHEIVYNHNKSLRVNTAKFAQQLRAKSAFRWNNLFIEEASAQDSSKPSDEDILNAGAVAMSLKHLNNYMELHNGAYRLKAGMGEDPLIYSSLSRATKTIETVRCNDTDDSALKAGKLATMAVHFKNSDRMEFQKMWSQEHGDFIYRLVTISASGDMKNGDVLVGRQGETLESTMRNFCNSPEDVRNEYVRGLQDVQLRNGDSGAARVSH